MIVSYKKVGGLHFVKLGRLGFNFYLTKSDTTKRVTRKSVSRRQIAPKTARPLDAHAHVHSTPPEMIERVRLGALFTKSPAMDYLRATCVNLTTTTVV